MQSTLSLDKVLKTSNESPWMILLKVILIIYPLSAIISPMILSSLAIYQTRNLRGEQLGESPWFPKLLSTPSLILISSKQIGSSVVRPDRADNLFGVADSLKAG